MSAVALIDADVFQEFAFRAEIAVLLGHVGELVDAVKVRRRSGIFLYPDVSSDATFIEPLQQFAVAVGGVRRQRLRKIAVTFAMAFDHVSGRYALLTQVAPASLAPPR